jgi:predicted O-methyltransferase YrrM
MYSSFQLALKYIHYFLTSSSGKGHGIHSPFIYELVTKVINDKRHYPEYDLVEALRKELLEDKTILTIEDYGAGSAVQKSNRRTIASIAKNSAKPAKFGQLLFRMVKYYQPKNIIELGTSLGITTAYLSAGNPEGQIKTLEGASQVAGIAKRNFNKVHAGNIQVVEGKFDDTLPEILGKIQVVDLAFIDGNHTRVPTLHYFSQLLPKIQNDSMLIFDDIHWSSEMEKSWEEIKQHSSIRCTIDLFFIGIVVFRHEFREKQHFTIRF